MSSAVNLQLLRQMMEGTTSVAHGYLTRLPDRLRAMVHRSQRDIVSNTTANFLTVYDHRSGSSWTELPLAMDLSNALKYAPSPSGQLMAVLTKRTAKKEGAKEQQFLDVWQASRRLARV